MKDQRSKEPGSTAGGAQPNRNKEADESSYKNVETSVNNPAYFNDDYEIEQENEMSTDEAKSEQAKEKEQGSGNH